MSRHRISVSGKKMLDKLRLKLKLKNNKKKLDKYKISEMLELNIDIANLVFNYYDNDQCMIDMIELQKFNDRLGQIIHSPSQSLAAHYWEKHNMKFDNYAKGLSRQQKYYMGFNLS